MRAEVNLKMYEGADFFYHFRWMTGDPDSLTPVNLDGYTAEMHIRRKIQDNEKLFHLSSATGEIEILDQFTYPGEYTIFLSGPTTLGVCQGHKDFVAVYDLFFFDLANPESYIAHQYGGIETIAAVTRYQG